MLERYRGTELRNKVIKRITEAADRRVHQRSRSASTPSNELEEMARIQRTRVDKMLALEDGKPMLISGDDRRNPLLKEMLVDLGRVQLETGFLDARAEDHQGRYGRTRNGEGIAFSWTEEQEKLYQELEECRAQRLKRSDDPIARALPRALKKLGRPGEYVWRERQSDPKTTTSGWRTCSRPSAGCAPSWPRAGRCRTRAAGRLPHLRRVRDCC